MTDRKSRRVVIINNINSETIDQAIFILKSDKRDDVLKRSADGDIVREAQNIINSYVRQVERLKGGYADRGTAKRKPARTRIPFGTILSVLAGLVSVFLIIGYIIR